MTDEEYEAMMTYILSSYKEVEPYIREFEEEMINGNVNIIEELTSLIEENDVQWFHIQMTANDRDDRLHILLGGFNKRVKHYSNYIVNNFCFSINALDGYRKT